MDVRTYETDDGFSPCDKWIDDLPEAAKPRVVTAIARMESGNLGDVMPVGAGVSERRLDFGPGYRLYFGRDGKEVVILLIGGTKRRQQRDIDTAKQYWDDYKSQKREAMKQAKANVKNKGKGK